MNDRYFVLWPDGQKFGPADLQTLQHWVVENRVGPATLLENAQTGHHIRAGDLPALQSFLPIGAHLSTGQQFVASNPNAGVAEVRLAWALGLFSISCCGLFASVAGLIVSAMALSKKQPTAVGALILNIVALGINLAGFGLMTFMPDRFNF